MGLVRLYPEDFPYFSPFEYDCNELLVSTDNQVRQHSIKTFPNPVQEVLHLKGEIPTNAMLEIRNIVGVLVKKQKIRSSQASVPIEDLPKGLYCLYVNGRFLEKIVKW